MQNESNAEGSENSFLIVVIPTDEQILSIFSIICKARQSGSFQEVCEDLNSEIFT